VKRLMENSIGARATSIRPNATGGTTVTLADQPELTPSYTALPNKIAAAIIERS
jgi:hypothetical protein